MIRKVETEYDRQLFNGIWMKAWEEKGFEYEFCPGDCYLVFHGGQAAGTVQFTLYVPEEADQLHEACRFDAIPALREPAVNGKVSIIDKFAIKKEFRSTQALDTLMFCLFQYAERHDKTYCIALLDPLVYRLVRFHYQFPVAKAGNRAYYKGADVIPVIIDCRYFLDRKLHYDWYVRVAALLQPGYSAAASARFA
jgi:hypothetical protein